VCRPLPAFSVLGIQGEIGLQEIQGLLLLAHVEPHQGLETHELSLRVDVRRCPGPAQDRLGAVGRMAFTSYLSHSIITAILFNYLGLYDRLDRFGGLVVTFLIFVFQLWVSPLWLAHFRFGPFEWVWRRLTYGCAMPMRVSRP